jgi:hypothetical protein
MPSIKCRYCAVTVEPSNKDASAFAVERTAESVDRDKYACAVECVECPSCSGLHVIISVGELARGTDGSVGINPASKRGRVIYPTVGSADIPEPIPEPYDKYFREAIAIQSVSPNGSAMLSRRILELVLTNEYGIDDYSLSDKIEKFVEKDEIPSLLRKTVDAVREVGNIGAHEQRDDETGEIVDVAPEEADFLVEVVGDLLDHTFVKPEKYRRHKDRINKKLRSIGRDELIQPDGDEDATDEA